MEYLIGLVIVYILYKMVMNFIIIYRKKSTKVEREYYLVKDFDDDNQVITLRLFCKLGKMLEYQYVGYGTKWKTYPGGELIDDEEIKEKFLKIWYEWCDKRDKNGQFEMEIN